MFKKGDKVRCINDDGAEGYLTIGQVYTVAQVVNPTHILIFGSAFDWWSDRFELAEGTDDNVNHPKHYTEIIPGIECIEVTEHMSFLRGNAVKYLWRAGSKGDEIEDLEKAVFYIKREIEKLKKERDSA